MGNEKEFARVEMAIGVEMSLNIESFCVPGRRRDGCTASTEDLNTFSREILTYSRDITTMRGEAKGKI